MNAIRIIIRYVIRLLHWVCLPLLLLACLVCRLLKKPVDVGLGPQPLINNVYWARALRGCGYVVETFADEVYSITGEFDVVLSRGWRRLFYYLPGLSFLRCAARYRAIYVYFDGGPLRHVPGLRLWEPWLFRLAGVKTAVMPYGSDCQLLERSRNKLSANMLAADYPRHFQKDHGRVTRQVNCWCKGADIVIASMDSIDYLFFWNRVRHCHFAIDTDAIAPHYPTGAPGRPLKILHMPNHKQIKGTAYLLRALDTLKSEGYVFEYISREHVPNSELLALMREADIVVDQLVMGAYAMFAMEAMAHGKPTICYIRPDYFNVYEDLGCLAPGEIPLINAEVGTITEVLRQLLDHPERLPDIGRRSRDYVVKYHSLPVVGAFFDEINRAMGVAPRGTPGTATSTQGRQ